MDTNPHTKFPEPSRSELPLRVIVKTPFLCKKIISYGLIVYSIDTTKWVLIQRKHSAELILYVKGLYKISALPFLLSKITKKEKIIIQTLHSATKSEYLKMASQLDIDLCRIDHDSAFYQMNATKEYANELFAVLYLDDNTLSWNWPKGRLDQTIPKESPFECAVREFNEEVESILPEPISVSNHYVSEILKTANGVHLESRYWVYIIDKECLIQPPIDNPEVSNRCWLSTSECLKKLQYKDLFLNLLKIMNIAPTDI